MEEEKRNRANAKLRERYANDVEYRERKKATRRERYANDEQYREKKKTNARKQYANDREFREKWKADSRAYYAANKEEISARCKHRREIDPEYRARHIKKRYGISFRDYRAMLQQQNYACGICERPFDRTPHVDHCHITNWVRGLLCRKCNLGLGHFEDNPAFLVKAARYMARWLLHVLQILNRKEHGMMTNDVTGGDSKASRMMRKAILQELHLPCGVDPPVPADNLQAIARALVTKAVAHDVSAIKEILDRVDGKTPSTPANNDLQQLVNLTWKKPETLSRMSPSKKSPSKKSRSTIGRATNSFPSTDEPSSSPAS